MPVFRSFSNLILAYIIVVRGCFEYRGRLTRAQFWMAYLVNVNIFALLLFWLIISESLFSSIVLLTYAVLQAFPFLSAGTKRLRDAGLSHLNMFWLLVPFLGGLVLPVLWLLPST